MQHKGVRYTIRAGIERDMWSVAIHPGGIESRARLVCGTREDAEFEACAMIDRWTQRRRSRTPNKKAPKVARLEACAMEQQTMKSLLFVAAFAIGVLVFLGATQPVSAAKTWADYPNSGYCPGTTRKVPDVAMCGGGGGGGGRGAAPPQAVRAACSDDAKRLCAAVLGDTKKRQACMREHRAELSAGCKAAVTQWRSKGAKQ
jgi:hypothetical protein